MSQNIWILKIFEYLNIRIYSRFFILVYILLLIDVRLHLHLFLTRFHFYLCAAVLSYIYKYPYMSKGFATIFLSRKSGFKCRSKCTEISEIKRQFSSTTVQFCFVHA